MHKTPLIIDALQYNNWSEAVFRQMRTGGVSAAHITIAYHENFTETVRNMIVWNKYFRQYSDYILHGRTAADVKRARAEGKTAIIFGFQNCSPIEDNIGLVQILHDLGARFMQLSYNNQSLLATGCYEQNDSGITRMGRQVIREMNRVGLVVDMSHSAERSTLEAIEISQRPIAITHANPSFWFEALRNKSDTVLAALTASGGMLGFSMYPHHLKNKSDCSLADFCRMIARTAEKFGAQNIGFGSDLCQAQPDEVVEWMRNGDWSNETDYGEGSRSAAGFPAQPAWFRDNTGFKNILAGLKEAGFNKQEIAGIAGGNWLSFFEQSFSAREAPA